jgi:hypothetical protein
MSNGLGDQVDSQASSQASVQKAEINMTFVSETVEWLKTGVNSGKQLVFSKVYCLTMSSGIIFRYDKESDA